MKKIDVFFDKLMNVKIVLIISIIGILIISFSTFVDSTDNLYKKVIKKKDKIIVSGFRYDSLDGHSIIKDKKDIYTGGVTINFSLSHPKDSKNEIFIDEIGIKLVEFVSGESSKLKYSENVGEIPGKGTLKPNIFTTKINKDGITSTMWVMSDGSIVSTLKNGSSISAFKDKRAMILTDSSGDIERFIGYIIPITIGLYKIQPYLNYSIKNETFSETLPEVYIYYE